MVKNLHTLVSKYKTRTNKVTMIQVANSAVISLLQQRFACRPWPYLGP